MDVLLICLYSCDIITTDMCGICDLKFEDHSMLISLANSSASRCGEIIVAILSKVPHDYFLMSNMTLSCLLTRKEILRYFLWTL